MPIKYKINHKDTEEQNERMCSNHLHLVNSATPGEVKAMVKGNIEILQSNPLPGMTPHETALAIPPMMLWGGPGTGKSSIFRDLAKEMGIGFIDVRLAQREPVDMRGLPVPEKDSVKWLVSHEWPRDPQSSGIIVFDELPAADRTLQVAAYEFILDRRLGELYTVPNGWYIVAAGNRIEDRAASNAMSSALANRFLHVEIQPSAHSWLQWAQEHNVHPAVIGFLRMRPALLFSQKDENLQRGWPSPRSWERVSTLLRIADISGNRKMLQFGISGLIGVGAASEFLVYLNNLDMLEKNADIYSKLKSGEPLFLPSAADQAYAYCEAIITFIAQEKERRAQQSMCSAFLHSTMDWPDDFCAMILSGLSEKLGHRKRNLTSQPEFKAWIDCHHLEKASCLK